MGSVHKNRLKNTFNRFVKDPRFWEEIEKMFRAGYFLEIDDLKVNKGSLLRPFLFNVFMHDFDQFMEILENQSIDIMLLFNHRNCGYFDMRKYFSLITSKYPCQTIQMLNASSKCNKKYFTI